MEIFSHEEQKEEISKRNKQILSDLWKKNIFLKYV